MWLRLTAVCTVAIGAALMACSGDSAETGSIHVIETEGTVGPIMERYLDRALDDAESSGARLAVIQLDTPGGLSSSMREIVQRIERASVPVAVYVYPSGGRAASAGTFITMSAHIAAMAPNTSIGAASAINSDGSDIEGNLGKKIEEDDAAFIRGIAELRGRNQDWAEKAVRDAVSASQSEALELDVIDYVANDLDHLLQQAEGSTVEIRPGVTATLTGLESAPRFTVEMTAWERFLAVLADPTVAALLISLGFLALVIELGNPGTFIPGTIGVIAITLGFLGFGVLPVDVVGIVLILIGLGLIAVEVFVPGGIFGAAGLVALVLGAIIAFRDTPAELRPPIWLMVLIAAIIGLSFAGLSLAVTHVRRMAAATGSAALIGKTAVARTMLAPEGYVFVQGERWRAQLEGGSAEIGDRVRVTGADGMRLRVRKENPQ